jgi:tetratricopeptide (TPR) repeat protein
MQEHGDLVRDKDGAWVEGSTLGWDRLPPKVEGVIEARIGRLRDELREILSVASVEGEEFTAQVVAQVQGVDELRVLRSLSMELDKRHHLVREQPTLQVGCRRLARYLFAHALFQEHLYGELSDGERALLHDRVARALESLYQGRLGDAVVRLARHYSEAGDKERALKYLVMAGDAALASYAHKEAEDYFRRGLALTPEEPEQAHLLRGLGEALHGLSRFEEAIRAWGEGIERYRALGDRDSVAHLYARSAWTAYLANDPAEALRLCLEGLEQVADAPESPGLVHLLHTTARAYGLNARIEEGRASAEQAFSMSERLGDVEAQAHALATLGGFYLQGEPAIEALERAVELAESRALLAAASRAHNNLGTILAVYQGRLQAAGEHYRRAAELEGQAGRTARQLYYLTNVVTNSLRVGKLRQAERMLSEARGLMGDLTEPTWGTQQLLTVELEHLLCRGEWTACAQKARALRQAAQREGRELDVAHAGLFLGWAVLESRGLAQDTTAGTWEEAGEALARTVEIFDGSRYHQLRVAARVRLAGILIQGGRIGGARQRLAECGEVIQPLTPAPRLESEVQWLAASVASAERRWAEAEAGFEGAAAVLSRLGLRWAWARSLLDWALFHVMRSEPGDGDRAVELLHRSLEAFEEMGSPGYVLVVQEKLSFVSA